MEQKLTDRVERFALVVTARSLEKHLAKRKKMIAALRDIDDTIRNEKKLIRDLTTPIIADLYAPTTDGPIADEGHAPGTISAEVMDGYKALGPALAALDTDEGRAHAAARASMDNQAD